MSSKEEFYDESGKYFIVVTRDEENFLYIHGCSFEYGDHEIFKSVLKQNNIGYYARPHEAFFMHEARKELEKYPEGVILEDMS